MLPQEICKIRMLRLAEMGVTQQNSLTLPVFKKFPDFFSLNRNPLTFRGFPGCWTPGMNGTSVANRYDHQVLRTE